MSALEIVVAVCGLAFLVVIHELGHLLAARIVGVGADRFSLFFGPAILKRRWHGVEWRLGSIPLGGYVRIRGTRRLDLSRLESLEEHLSPTESDAVAEQCRVLERTHELPEAIAALDELERVLEHTSLPSVEQSRLEVWLAEARERTAADSWWLAKPWKKIFIAFAGPLANIGLAFVLLMVAFMSGGTGRATTQIDRVVSGTPAAQAHLVAGDRVLAVDGRHGYSAIAQEIESSQGRTLHLLVQAPDKSRHRVAVRARYNRTVGYWQVGVEFHSTRVYYTPWSAARQSVDVMTGTARSSATVASQAVRGQKQASDQLMGPVGVVRLSASVVQSDVRAYIGVLALISLSLALLNLLPILPLDGGQIVVAALEALRRRRLSPTSEAAFLLAGMGVVLVMMFVGLGNDLRLR